MPPKAVKINLTYPENHFYEKVLTDWKKNASDSNGRFVVNKALENLKRYPLRINGYADLKTIKGIGEDFANRLDGALKFYKEVNGSNYLNLEKIRSLKSGDALRFLCESTVSRGKKAIPFLSVEVRQNIKLIAKCVTSDKTVGKIASSDQNKALTVNNKFVTDCPMSSTSESSQRKNELICDTPTESITTSSTLSYYPTCGALPQILLIVDNRENRRDCKSKGICDHLDKMNVQYDLRPLAVGDYLWTLRMGTGHDKEIVMDFIIERKTWDDLKTSIRQSRYHEQKQRLKQSGIKNIVLLVEGSSNHSESSLEQAIVSTCIQDGFMVQRAQSPTETAEFLRNLTNYLIKRIRNQEFSGKLFSAFQEESKKTKQLTVADCFLRQLTVCPRMTSSKAQMVVSQFPSLRTLRQLFLKRRKDENFEDILHNVVPGIPPQLSKQISLFFS